jgi:hypothetical protein
MRPTRKAKARAWLWQAQREGVQVYPDREAWELRCEGSGPQPELLLRMAGILKADLIAVLTNPEAEHSQGP